VGTVDVRSRLETAFLQLCDDYGIPRPIVNGHVLVSVSTSSGREPR